MDRLARLVINPQAQVAGLRCLIDRRDLVCGVLCCIRGKCVPPALILAGFTCQLGVQRYSFRTLLVDPSLERDGLQVPSGGVIVLLTAVALRLRRLERSLLCAPAAGGQGEQHTGGQ